MQVINSQARVNPIGLHVAVEGVLEYLDGALILPHLLVRGGKVDVAPRIVGIETPSLLHEPGRARIVFAT